MKKSLLAVISVMLALILTTSCWVLGISANKKYSEYKVAVQSQSSEKYELHAESSYGAELTENADKGKVISLGEGDSVTWNVNISSDGNYWIEVDYYALPDTYDSISIDLLIDGQLPFSESAGLPLERSWINENTKQYDIYGNQIRPTQKEVQMWRTKKMRAVDASSGDLEYYLSAGAHTLTIQVSRESCLIDKVTLSFVTQVKSYSEVFEEYEKNGYKSADVENLIFEAEGESVKSNQSLYPITDRSSAAITPYSAELIYYNAVGGTQWKTAGQWIEWTVNAEKDGLYELSFHFKQNNKSDAVSVRELYIDGQLPFVEAANICFPYSSNWDMFTCGYEEGDDFVPYKFYLTEGKHILRLQVGLGSYHEIIAETDRLITELNSVYRKIVVVTGVSPDLYASYEFEKVIPDVLEYMQSLSTELKALENNIRNLGFSGNQGTDTIKRLYNQIDWMLEDTDTIAKRLTTYREAISSLGTWRNSISEQPLTLDKIYLISGSESVPEEKSGLFKTLAHHIRQFLYSYVSDYSSIGEIEEDVDKKITVWMNSGRDQAQILKSLVSQNFTPNAGVAVDLQIVSADALLPALLAGTGPDISLGLAQTEPLNLALRGALLDLKSFPDYDEVSKRFYSESIVPFEFEGCVYALPDTLSYTMLFYRTDVIDEIGIATDELATWDSLLQKVLPVVQKNGLTIGIPANINTYLSIFYQTGGEMYINNNTASGFSSAEAIQSMNLFEKLYSQYKLDLAFDAANRFRSGEMPILINDYLFYNQLTVFAPEIDGAWSMLVMPGVEKKDGSINNLSTSTVTGTVIMKSSQDTESAWNFVKWLLSTETQSAYGRDLESVVGTAARYNTANVEAMNLVKWDADIKQQLEKQRVQIKAYPQIAGGYITDREFNFAFRKIIYDDESVRESMNEATKNINYEIIRKREEFGLK